MAAVQERDDFYVPTIDISPFLHDPHSPQSQVVLEQVRQACLSTGFFQITGHGLGREVRDGLFDGAARFFQLPHDEKLKLNCHTTPGFRGYDALATETFEEGVLPDLKEGFFVGDDIAPDHPQYGMFFSALNVWPPEERLARDGFRAPVERYYAAVRALSFKVVNLVGATLLQHLREQGETLMPTAVEEVMYSSASPIMVLRLLHYPPVAPNNVPLDKPQYGASAHTDYGLLTLLLQDENPGLEVLDTSPSALATGRNIWRPIPPTPDAFVVNIADIFSTITGGLYKSSVHRVICKKPEKERFSVAFFVDGCLDAKLHPVQDTILDGHMQPPDDPARTVQEHLIDRLTMSYNDQKKLARLDGETVAY